MRNKERWIWIGLLAIMILVWYFQPGDKPEVVRVPVKVPVTVNIPAVSGQFETIYLPEPKKESPKQVKDFENLPTDQEKTEAFREATTIRDYEKLFTDQTQEVTVSSKVQGHLLEQDVSYLIYPKTVDTTVKTEVEVPIKYSRALLLGAEIGVPVQQDLEPKPVFKANVIFKNKRDQTFSIGYDTEGRAWIGTSIKIF